MLAIVQAGQAAKNDLLLDMHRLRKRVFSDRMKWDVSVTPDGLEVDDFDLPEALYLLALNDNGRVIGNWRLLPSIGPTMIGKVWPQFLDTIELPSSPLVWEASRFAVDSLDCESQQDGLAQVSRATEELFCGLTQLCLLCGIKEVFTMYDMRIARLLRRLNCSSRLVSERLRIADTLCEVGIFTTDEIMLKQLQKATGRYAPLVTSDMLPPILQGYHLKAAARDVEVGYVAA